MALQRASLPVPFVGGLDTKTDQKQLPLGKLLVLENGTFVNPKKIKKRPGGAALTTNILGGGSITSGAQLFTRAQTELLLGDTDFNLYSYDQANTAWAKKGLMASVTPSLQTLGATQYTVRNVDIALASNGLICAVYELFDQNGTSSQAKGCAYSIVDSTTGQLIVAPTIFASVTYSWAPRVVYLGTNFVFFWIEQDTFPAGTATLYATTLSSTAPLTALPVKSAITSGVTTSALQLPNSNQGQYDAKTNQANTAAYIAFTSRSNTATCFRMLAATPTTVSNTKTSALGAGTNYISYALVPDSNGNIVVAGVIATEMDYAVYNTDFSLTVVAAVAADTGQNGLACVTGVATAAGIVTFFYGGAAGGDVRKQYIRFFTTSAGYSATTPNKLIGSLSVGGQAFAITMPSGTVTAFCPAWFSTVGVNGVDTQGTAFVVDTSGHVLASGINGAAGCFTSAGPPVANGGSPANGYLVGSTLVAGHTATLSQARSQRAIGSLVNGQIGSALLYQFGPVALSFNFADSTYGYQSAELANALHTSGMIYMYDGSNVVEHGFLQYPWDIVLAAGAGGSLTSGGTYFYQVTYEWMDAQGQVHRSAPGFQVGSGSLGANTKVTLTIPTLRCTQKTNVLITVWRTTNAGATWYQVNNFNGIGTLYNDPTVDTVTWVDTLADTAIIGNPQLYTTGGVLANYPANPLGAMCVHRDRVFGVDLQNPTQIWFTNKVQSPAPLEWSPFNVIGVDQSGGGVTSLASVDDKLILFRADKYTYLVGDGPDLTGGQNDFLELPVASDTGCSIPRSIVKLSTGVIFKSPKGFYQLDRALQLSYIGAPVEAYNSDSIWAATVMSDENQVRFLDITASSLLVYDSLMEQWSSFTYSGTTAPQTGAVVWGGKYTYLNVNGTVVQETPGVFSDPGNVFISMKVQTGWISLAGVQSFQRLYLVQLLGDYVSAHRLNVTLAFDYKAVSQTDNITVAADPQPYQFGIRPKIQRCQAVQITIQDVSTGTIGEAMSLSSLAFEYGSSGRLRHMPKGQTYG